MPSGQRGGFQLQLDDDVDVLRDRPGGVVVGDVGAGLHRTRHQLPQRRLGVGRRGWCEIDPVPDSIALIIATISAAADLTDDLPGQVEPERVVQRLIQSEFAGLPAVRAAFPRPGPGLPRQCTIGCWSGISCKCSSYSVSNVPIASCVGISAHNARTIVVFPAPCGPATTMRLAGLHRRGQKRRRHRRQRAQPDQIRRGVTRCSRCRRITTDGRGVTHAAAASRAPPSSRRCNRGWAGQNGRAFTSDRDARKTRKSISS